MKACNYLLIIVVAILLQGCVRTPVNHNYIEFNRYSFTRTDEEICSDLRDKWVLTSNGYYWQIGFPQIENLKLWIANDTQRIFVVRIVEGREEDWLTGDIEIHYTRGPEKESDVGKTDVLEWRFNFIVERNNLSVRKISFNGRSTRSVPRRMIK